MRNRISERVAPASDYIFPVPRRINRKRGVVRLPGAYVLDCEDRFPWLIPMLNRALKKNGVSFSKNASTGMNLKVEPEYFKKTKKAPYPDQAYELVITESGVVSIMANTDIGLQYGVLTLIELFEARAQKAELTPLTIVDSPKFDVRGLQVDVAREFLPPMHYLKKIVDRMVRLKLNTLWLYLENRFRAKGMEDISPPNGITYDQAREISEYASERGIDVVPGSNVLSHMEGWFRLERYSHFCDGRTRSYPVLTAPEILPLVFKYLDELCDAFPSPNIQLGLDELLFTGTNPDAQNAIDKQGKPVYFADFAEKIIEYVKRKGKTIWIWDDMVLGKNIDRKEGFQKDYRQALDRIPDDIIFTHWYYWTNSDGMHRPIIERVGKEGRPFVVAPSSQGHRYDTGDYSYVQRQQKYMAGCGEDHGAFGYVNTHWESRHGFFLESLWPLHVLFPGFAWFGGNCDTKDNFKDAWSFNVTRNLVNGLSEFTDKMTAIQQALDANGLRLRSSLIVDGSHIMWRMLTSKFSADDLKNFSALVTSTEQCYQKMNIEDQWLRKALALPLTLCRLCLDITDAYDSALSYYHQAALIERSEKKRFHANLDKCCDRFSRITELIKAFCHDSRFILRTGHTPYDFYALKQHCKSVDKIPVLIRKCAREGIGMPHFQKLLYLPNDYKISNYKQFELQNTFYDPFEKRKVSCLYTKKP